MSLFEDVTVLDVVKLHLNRKDTLNNYLLSL